MIHVIAIITAKSGMREDILREFRANMPAVHAETGCIEYGPATDTPEIGKFQTPFGPDTFVVIEKWESPDALKAHAAAPHMAAYAAKTSRPAGTHRPDSSVNAIGVGPPGASVCPFRQPGRERG